MGFMDDLRNTDPSDNEGMEAVFEQWRALDPATKAAHIDQAEMRLQKSARTLIEVWSGAVMEVPEQASFVVGINTLEAMERGDLGPVFGDPQQMLMVTISAIVLLLREKMGVAPPDLEEML